MQAVLRESVRHLACRPPERIGTSTGDKSRNEARIEQRVPKAATWLDDDERRLLDMSNASHD